MEVIRKLAQQQSLPKFVKVKQNFEESHIKAEDIKDRIYKELDSINLKDRIEKGMSVCITCGSRGIANIALITKSIGDYFIDNGAKPFVAPTMGSHGGATAEGQVEILESFGVTEEYLGFPIKATMDTVHIGDNAEGNPVYIDKNAAEADGIFVAGRIKNHTAFEGEFESGIMKMITIGLGKQHGAEVVHEPGFGTAHHNIPLYGKTTIKNTNIVGALGIIENAYDETNDLVAMTKEEITIKEPELLKKAKKLIGRILVPEADVLIVDEIGKDISGDGMDPNVTGRFGTPYKKGGLKCQRITVLDLTDHSNGNFNGLGLSDVTTKRVADKVDYSATYPNAITSTVLDMVKVPMTLPDDKTAIQIAVRSCNNIDKENPRIIRIKNTMELNEIEVSESLIPVVEKIEDMEIISDKYELGFNDSGNLLED